MPNKFMPLKTDWWRILLYEEGFTFLQKCGTIQIYENGSNNSELH
jgi:hypothetical protein